MVKVKIPEKYRQKVIAFYTDEEGRVWPITAKTPQVWKLKERRNQA